MFNTPKTLFTAIVAAFAVNSTQAMPVYKYSAVNPSGAKHGQQIYKRQKMLASWDNVFELNTGNKKMLGASFKINVSDIKQRSKNKRWQGISFDKEIGLWFHPSKNSRFSYEGEELKRYAIASRKRTISVPEPETIALLAIGVAGLGLSRRGEREQRDLETQ